MSQAIHFGSVQNCRFGFVHEQIFSALWNSLLLLSLQPQFPSIAHISLLFGSRSFHLKNNRLSLFSSKRQSCRSFCLHFRTICVKKDLLWFWTSAKDRDKDRDSLDSIETPLAHCTMVQNRNKPGRAMRCIQNGSIHDYNGFPHWNRLFRWFFLHANWHMDTRTDGRTVPHIEMRGPI